jgi:hypothetical protein
VSREPEVTSLSADHPRTVALRSPDDHVMELIAALPGRFVDDTARDSDHDVNSSGTLRAGVAAGEYNVHAGVSSGEFVRERTQQTGTEAHT